MQEYSHESFQVTGLQLTTNTQNAFADIGKAWETINSQNLFDVIEHKAYPGLHNVYYNFTNQDDLDNRGYDVLIGFITDNNHIQNDSRLTTIIIPAQDYKYTTVQGEMPQSVVEKWNEINSLSMQEVNRSFGFDLDMYNEGGTECTITVAVNK